MSNDVVSQIKARLNIEDVVSQYVTLKRAGQNLKGLCPFHSEKSPSFVVSPERGIAYCFGCHKGGDIFKFMQEIEGLGFGEVLKILAEKAGVQLENQKFEKGVSKDERSDLLDIHEDVAKFYEQKLWYTMEGNKVLEYMRRRGITDETMKKFRVGYSPDSYDETFTMLLKKKYEHKKILQSGLALARDTNLSQIYDRFRGRLMFPITDTLGRIVGFGGRALKADQEPKYLNSPETPIYQKGQLLYGFSWTKPAIKIAKKVLIVEGYMDLLAAYQNGAENVVAVSGTALTARQLNHLKPFIQELILGFDMDLAGQEAAKRSYEIAKDFDFEVKIFFLPEGKDIAEYSLQNPGKILEIIPGSKLYTEYYYDKILAMYSGSSQKHKIIKEFSVFFERLKSTIEKDEFVRRLAKDLNLNEVQIYDEIKNMRLATHHPARTFGEGEAKTAVRKFSALELIIGLLMESPKLLLEVKDILREDHFEGFLKDIYKKILDSYNLLADGQVILSDDFHWNLADLEQETVHQASLLGLYIAEQNAAMGQADLGKELSSLTQFVLKEYMKNHRKRIIRKIEEAERIADFALRDQLMKELNSLHIL